jgi:hypothetical protein
LAFMESLELTSPLDVWQITLTSGEVVDVAAHGASEEAGYLVFKALMKGRPHFEMTVAAFPESAVAG